MAPNALFVEVKHYATFKIKAVLDSDNKVNIKYITNGVNIIDTTIVIDNNIIPLTMCIGEEYILIVGHNGEVLFVNPSSGNSINYGLGFRPYGVRCYKDVYFLKAEDNDKYTIIAVKNPLWNADDSCYFVINDSPIILDDHEWYRKIYYSAHRMKSARSLSW